MDGNSLEQLLAPEAGQATEPVSNPAPEPSAEPSGQVTDPAQQALDGGQGADVTYQEEMISKAQYDELRKAFTQKSMELANYKRGVQQPQQVQVPQTQAPQNPLQEIINRQVAEAISEFVTPIQQQQQDFRIQTKVMELSERKEFSEVAETFVTILEEQPELLDLQNGIDLAYNAAVADYYQRASIAAVQARQSASQQTTAQKIAVTETPQARSAQPVGEADAEAQQIRDSILSLGRRKTIF